MKTKRSKRRSMLAIFTVLILLISIGYAALSSELSITTSATIKKQSWLVYFDNVQIAEGSITAEVEPETEGQTTTSIDYTVNLDTPGQFYEFTVDVVNGGKIDAMIETVINDVLTEAQAKYLSYSVTYVDGEAIEQYDRLLVGETETLKVKLVYRQDIDPEDLPTENETINLKLESTYVQADDNAKDRERLIHTVTYNANGGENAPASQEKIKNTDLTLTSDIPTREESTFRGWIEENGTKIYQPGEEFTENRDVTLNAIWSYSGVDIVNSNDYTYSLFSDEGKISMGNALVTCNVDKEGYKITGRSYNTQVTVTITLYDYFENEIDSVTGSNVEITTTNDTFKLTVITPSGEFIFTSEDGNTVYIKDSIPRFTWTFYMNDGTDTIFRQVTGRLNSGTGWNPNDLPTREGYTFIGWNEDPNATSGSTINRASFISDETYYAIWQEN